MNNQTVTVDILENILSKYFEKLALKDELNQAVANLATKDELNKVRTELISKLATKEELNQAVANLATKDELNQVRTELISKLATKEELDSKLLSTKDELITFTLATKEELKASIDRIALKVVEHDAKFDVVFEKLDKLSFFENIQTTIDKMANDFHNYRVEQEISNHHLREHWNILEDHEGRIRELEA